METSNPIYKVLKLEMHWSSKMYSTIGDFRKFEKSSTLYNMQLSNTVNGFQSFNFCSLLNKRLQFIVFLKAFILALHMSLYEEMISLF